MAEKKDYNNPKKIFKEQDDLIVSRQGNAVGQDNIVSVRQFEVTSIAPEDINWDNIYSGKTGGLQSIRPEAGFPPTKRS